MPGYFLPEQVILKSLKPGWDDEFENEKAMYTRLASLQGRLIPTFLGEAQYKGSPAVVLSFVDGVLPFQQDVNSPLAADEFERLVESALWEFTAFGVAYGDTKLDNFLIVGDGVVLLDLEAVSEVEPQLYKLAVTSHLDHIMHQYRSYLENRHEYY
ncbi:Protein kinase-like domain protein [Metarhizium rileyi]|uniref:Protein kinase-like domain protein n=1 Tax=Metarhizium rileyi (strain RCEF 4871) TaxID=1649241 RepID=A0A162M419_METRR|nr:Protein kinase-like domain protein [Metarhizium rileyi RCEF 4871]